MTDLRLKCPECHDHAKIDITATIDVRLKQYSRDGEDFSTDADDSRNGDHEWDETHDCSCGCGWHGKVGMLMRGGERNHKFFTMGCLVCGGIGNTCVGAK